MFFYWDYFNRPHKDGRDFDNSDEFDGHLSCDLFIENSKYANLKEEILSNDDNEIDDTDTFSKQFMKSMKVKQTKYEARQSWPFMGLIF